MMANNYNIPKIEDTIECFFYSLSQVTETNLCDALNNSISSLSQDYLWHRDEFKLCVSVLDGELKDPVWTHLKSTTCFGDNIEDEWFIVYLILQLTSEYTDLVVCMEDNDGDFLLIEAADHLPSWANPETTENRVFIYQNQVHLIPPEVVSLESKLQLQDALNLVTQKPEETKASEAIQECVRKRINGYPQKIKESHHRALVTLPIDLAALLKLKPSLISPIVTSYCNHDIIDAKCFKNMKFEHLVTTPVLFTRHLYAMVMNSKLVKTTKGITSKQNKELNLGMKLAYGNEIIMSKLFDDIFNSNEYNKFIDSLTKNGYFKDNIEGSKQYTELLKKAKDYFSNIECPLPSFNCHNMTELMKTDTFKCVRDSLENQNTSLGNIHEVDTEEWLNINPDELNTFLNTHYGKKLAKNNVSSVPEMTTELANYLKKSSDFEGIEHDREEIANENQIEFDSDEFMNCIEKMLNIVTAETNNSDDYDSDLSEEGTLDTMHIEEDIENELSSKLQNVDGNRSMDEDILKNLLNSIREEGISGPTSNILKNIDI